MKTKVFSIFLSFFVLLSFSASLLAADGPFRIALFKDGGVSDKTCASVSKVV